MILRDCQERAVEDFKSWLASESKRRLYISPTGSGKSILGLSFWEESKPLVTYLVAPTDEILQGWAVKAGVGDTSKETLETLGYYTPIRLRNVLAAGSIPQPDLLIVDEAHHSEAETHQLIEALAGDPRQVGLTATGFRGNAKGTKDFKTYWGEPYQVITLAESVSLGFTTMPTCRIIPLLDDDTVKVVNGEFQVKSLENATKGVIAGIVDLCLEYLGPPFRETLYDKPTMIAMPSVATAKELTEALNTGGAPAICVVGETKDRNSAFDACVSRRSILVQVNVVSEGVDLPIRRLIDASPTISPVKWVQRFGRITRPGGNSEYICLNRNLLRHAYLLEGLFPASKYSEEAAKFEKPSVRSGIRTLGFESLGRFKGTEVPLANGTSATLYCVSSVEGNTVVQYAAAASPVSAEVLYAKRVNVRGADGTSYSSWERVPNIPDIDSGFASVPAPRMTEKQAAWWKRDAAKYGLNGNADVNARTFQLLPIVCNTRFFNFRG